jgi:hypothetical protein
MSVHIPDNGEITTENVSNSVRSGLIDAARMLEGDVGAEEHVPAFTRSESAKNNVVIDHSLIGDVIHRINRRHTNGVEGYMSTLNAVLTAHRNDATVYMDHGKLDNIDQIEYEDAIRADGLAVDAVQNFLRKNTRDLRLEEWAEHYDIEDEDELYAAATHALGGTLLTNDGDCGDYTHAVNTPGGYMEAVDK